MLGGWVDVGVVVGWEGEEIVDGRCDGTGCFREEGHGSGYLLMVMFRRTKDLVVIITGMCDSFFTVIFYLSFLCLSNGEFEDIG